MSFLCCCFAKPPALEDEGGGVYRREEDQVGSFKRLRSWKKTPRLLDKYELLEMIGEGKTGRVYRVMSVAPPSFEAAAKMVTKEYLHTPERQRAFAEELAIVQRVQHPSLLKVLDVYKESDKHVIVMERAFGGEVMETITSSRFLSERDVAWIIRELLTVVEYLHANGITHRDIKVDNILCRTTELRDGIVLIDFGLAHQGGGLGVHDMTGMNGTCHFMAPEMFGRESQYGCEIDLWAVGVVTYILLFGHYPFDARFMSQVEDKIVAGDYEFPPETAHKVSTQAIEFIEHLLVVNPLERPTASDALSHPWMDLENCSTRKFSDPHMEQLRSFQDARRPPSTHIKMNTPPIVPLSPTGSL
ncbi:hypothetical protein Poli38472_005244 [Pythium oligandrum]|uniref:Protein kinase domain-containing protein n=1 Tax=Pythium oligandrum TaxID=41045 RepID=A0A8K1FHE3_PYTOL|nr:hypothetical protein Poli38472_005244 [Pythium oligandrum]|eukprot:TMW62626.1 hypothetical protein Poli38472_005244 [Pythium oligandrum]